MCFLGSEKYPGENAYKSYLAQHGGRSNASTSMHQTTYKFEILADFAEHALEIFSQFFVAPLFTKSGTGREVKAVDSENSKNLTADARRRLQILKDLGDPSHYYTKFSTGNSNTLRTNNDGELEHVRDALLAFHRKHYLPSSMTVVVVGPQTLDILQEWCVSRFSAMINRPSPSTSNEMTSAEKLVEEASKHAPPHHFGSPVEEFRSPFRPELQGKWPALVTVKPMRSMRRLVMMFPLPPTQHDPDRSPSSVLSHLLGHEGPSSSFAILQNAGLLSSLSAGPRTSGPDFTLFQLNIGLTELGEKEWKKVVGVIFEHCRLIAKAAKEERKGKSKELRRIWGENAKIHRMFFDQASPPSAFGFAPSFSSAVVLYGTERSISQGSMLNESEETLPLEAIEDFAARLVPSNCLIERCSEDAWSEAENMGCAMKKVEQWYGIDYFVSSLDDADASTWLNGTNKARLALPPPNEYIPRSLQLCSDLPEEAKQGPRIEKDIEPPNLLINDENGRLWHRLDDRYALPKSHFSILVRNALVENRKADEQWVHDPNASVLSSLLSGIFSDALAQETYDADLAGLRWNISLGSEGIRFTFGGFSDRLPDLVAKVLSEFASAHFLKESFFVSSKDKMIRSLKTYLQSRRADSHAIYYRDFLLGGHGLGIEKALEASEKATLDSVAVYHKALLENQEQSVDCLCAGNISEAEARNLHDTVTAFFKKDNTSSNTNIWLPGAQERRLIPRSDFELHFSSKNEQEENGAVVISFQSQIPGYRGPALSTNESLQSSAAIRLLCHILREPLFDELRTKQTLGYIVSSYYDIGVSKAPSSRGENWSVPVDFIVVNVLSRKAAPDEIVRRIDDFLISFRGSLKRMPKSQIEDHASALSTKLLKPIQDLRTEASNHFSKIRNYGFESSEKLPWITAPILAAAIRGLGRDELLETWDRMMHTSTRCRLVSCVYGSTFPLDFKLSSDRVVVDDLGAIIGMRKKLEYFDNTATKIPKGYLARLMASSNLPMLAVGTGAAVAAAAFLWRSRRASK